MTYGWAILVVLISISSLAYFGVLNPGKLLPTSCTFVPGISCDDSYITSTSFYIVVTNGFGLDLVFSTFNLTAPSGNSYYGAEDITLIDGASAIYDLNITNEQGHPIQRRGLTKYNGLYFMGLQWMHSSKSAQFVGVAEDANYIVKEILSKDI